MVCATVNHVRDGVGDYAPTCNDCLFTSGALFYWSDIPWHKGISVSCSFRKCDFIINGVSDRVLCIVDRLEWRIGIAHIIGYCISDCFPSGCDCLCTKGAFGNCRNIPADKSVAFSRGIGISRTILNCVYNRIAVCVDCFAHWIAIAKVIRDGILNNFPWCLDCDSTVGASWDWGNVPCHKRIATSWCGIECYCVFYCVFWRIFSVVACGLACRICGYGKVIRDVIWNDLPTCIKWDFACASLCNLVVVPLHKVITRSCGGT